MDTRCKHSKKACILKLKRSRVVGGIFCHTELDDISSRQGWKYNGLDAVDFLRITKKGQSVMLSNHGVI